MIVFAFLSKVGSMTKHFSELRRKKNPLRWMLPENSREKTILKYEDFHHAELIVFAISIKIRF
jgi:hypothetical protein